MSQEQDLHLSPPPSKSKLSDSAQFHTFKRPPNSTSKATAPDLDGDGDRDSILDGGVAHDKPRSRRKERSHSFKPTSIGDGDRDGGDDNEKPISQRKIKLQERFYSFKPPANPKWKPAIPNRNGGREGDKDSDLDRAGASGDRRPDSKPKSRQQEESLHSLKYSSNATSIPTTPSPSGYGDAGEERDLDGDGSSDRRPNSKLKGRRQERFYSFKSPSNPTSKATSPIRNGDGDRDIRPDSRPKSGQQERFYSFKRSSSNSASNIPIGSHYGIGDGDEGGDLDGDGASNKRPDSRPKSKLEERFYSFGLSSNSPSPATHLSLLTNKVGGGGAERWNSKDNGGDQDQVQEQEIVPGPYLEDPQIRLALYIAMAHAGLALSLGLLFGLAKLLQEYWRPIQWALLCSVPLRELQIALVRFWARPLRLGPIETLVAAPLVVLRLASASVSDSQSALFSLLRRSGSSSPSASGADSHAVGFPQLMRWVVSFGIFVLAYERLGIAAILAFSAPALAAKAASPCPHRSSFSGIAASHSSFHLPQAEPLKRSFLVRSLRRVTSAILRRLQTVVGIGLITILILGSLFALVLFSYKIGMEGKDAMITLKTHLEESNYTERIGLKTWMDERNIPELIDTYTEKFYETISQHVDSLAVQYNATEIIDGFRHFLIKMPSDDRPFAPTAPNESSWWKLFAEKLRHLHTRLHRHEFRAIYLELDDAFRAFMSVITKEDLAENIKGVALQSINVSKRLLTSSTTILSLSANMVFRITSSIILGAAEFVNFVSQLMVFLWLLYYLMTSESGGVMEHVLGMLPVSKATRDRCAEVLDHAVSSVLLATAKVALFQGCFTYVLFRFYRIHFLYMSTFFALLSAVLPIMPMWLSSLPAAAQLAVESRVLEAFLLSAVHLILLDFGTSAIMDDIPGQSSYLTGLSILGGMALFPSALEGAIMGPLLMTVIVTLKNLYAEFVLGLRKESK